MNVREILTGVGDLYIAPVGTEFPGPDETPDSPWIYLGVTQDGVTVVSDQEIEEITCDQRTGPIKAVRTSENVTLETKLAQFTLENLAVVLGREVINTPPSQSAIGTREVSLYRGDIVQEYALIFRGTSPYGDFPAQYELPRGYLAEALELEYTKDGNVAIPVRFRALEDLNATNPEERFGRLVVKTANKLSS